VALAPEGRRKLKLRSKTKLPVLQEGVTVTGLRPNVPSPVRQRRRITARLRAEVVEHYAIGMTSRQVAATFGLGRTTVLEILKAAGLAVRPRGRNY